MQCFGARVSFEKFSLESSLNLSIKFRYSVSSIPAIKIKLVAVVLQTLYRAFPIRNNSNIGVC